ncbi:MAG TPA: uroporphyrinogen-III synthase [Natronosporangium sp.]|nr:uroporphyrinogen-III synthase [Natronosporangium sp.]
MPHRVPPSTSGGIPPLAGYTVAVASDRRRHLLADLLESVGARTVGIQAARSVAKPDPEVLREATDRCLAGPIHELVVSSPLGLRAWLAEAERQRRVGALLARFAAARLLARDAAAADGLRALGFRQIYSTDQETTEDLLRYLAAQPLAGRRVVVQTDRMTLSESCRVLAAAGAEVIEVPTFTPSPPAEVYSLRRLFDLLWRRQVDALALLGATVTSQFREQATRAGRLPEVITALQKDVLCIAISPASAAALTELAVPVRTADRPFVEEVAEDVLTTLPSRSLHLSAGGHRLEVRGQAVVLDGRLIPMPGGPLAVLRALARRPGEVLSAAEIRDSEPTWADVDDHAVEMAVSRLRRLLKGADLIQTIVKRGYRLVA